MEVNTENLQAIISDINTISVDTTNLQAIISNIGTINANITNLQAIISNISEMNIDTTNLQAIISDIANIETQNISMNTALATINTNIGTINTAITQINAHQADIDINIESINDLDIEISGQTNKGIYESGNLIASAYITFDYDSDSYLYNTFQFNARNLTQDIQVRISVYHKVGADWVKIYQEIHDHTLNPDNIKVINVKIPFNPHPYIKIFITNTGSYSLDYTTSLFFSKKSAVSELLHNELDGLNAGDSYEHISQAQKDALHDVLTNLNQLTTRDHTDLQNVLAAQHHAKYTDLEVEAVITAELAGGQSIDNAIDTLIAQHSIAESTDHDNRYYTEAEVDGIITVHEANPIDINHLTDVQLAALHPAVHTHDGDTLQLDGINSNGGIFEFQTSLNINFKTDNDNDDYVQITTVADIPYINFIGGNGKITNLANGVDPTDAMAFGQKWTTINTEAVITAELAGGQSIDNAIDTLIAQHSIAESTDHDDRYYTETEVDAAIAATYTNAEINALFHIGAGNSGWKNLPLGMPHVAIRMQGDAGWYNTGADDPYVIFDVPIDHIQAGDNLVINTLKLSLDVANLSNFVKNIIIYGWTDHTTFGNVYIDGTDRKAAGEFDYDLNDIQIGGVYDRIVVSIQCTTANAAALRISGVQLEYYYV